ncbi:acyltransferase [Vibrio ostreicida]|uniref:acyltransferase n=1 Tax=Vibrio ostreicida TaxID=526588 RepID=UPI0009707FA1|nr:acyltransferase [Vibrio ostreicida]
MLLKIVRKIKSIFIKARLESLSSIQYAFGVDSSAVLHKIGIGSISRASITFEKSGAEFCLGDNSSLGGGTILSIAEKIDIGDDVLVSFNCIFTDNNGHSTNLEVRKNDLSNYLQGKSKNWEDVSIAAISIGNGCWIGAGTTILKGVKIGENCIIGAGSVVVSEIPKNSIAAGNPARVIKSNV